MPVEWLGTKYGIYQCGRLVCEVVITGGHSKLDPILLVKIGKYIGFCVYRRSYLLWSPVIMPVAAIYSAGMVGWRIYTGTIGVPLLYHHVPNYKGIYMLTCESNGA